MNAWVPITNKFYLSPQVHREPTIIKLWLSFSEDDALEYLFAFLVNIKRPEEYQFDNLFFAATFAEQLTQNEETLPLLIKLQKCLSDLTHYQLQYKYELYLDTEATNLVKTIQTQGILSLGRSCFSL